MQPAYFCMNPPYHKKIKQNIAKKRQPYIELFTNPLTKFEHILNKIELNKTHNAEVILLTRPNIKCVQCITVPLV